MTALRKNDIVEMGEIEHILHRPGIYIGSTVSEDKEEFIYKDNKIVKTVLSVNEGLVKIFDEIISNSLDEAIRTNFKYANIIKIDLKDDVITVKDNGRGLPIEQNDSGKWIPEVIFTQLRAGSNFNDETKGEVIGTNGVGSALTNIFSTNFEVETTNGSGKKYKQKFENSSLIKHKPKLADCGKDHYTIVSFKPNYDYFNVTEEKDKKDFECLIFKRIQDLAFCYPEISFYYNSKKILGSNLKNFMHQIHEVHECSQSDKVRVGIFYSDTEFQQISFINGANTRREGTHVNYVTNKIVNYLIDHLKKKYKIDAKPIDIKSKLFLIFSLRMLAPKFDSQTKERLITPYNEYSKLIDEVLNEKFLKSLTKNEEIIEPIVEAYKLKKQVEDNLQLKKVSKTGKREKIEKFMPAIKEQKYLMLTEGDGAKGAISVSFGREFYSYFPLRGKPLNALEVQASKITENAEIKNITKILGLQLDNKKPHELTHEYILIATDADLDGTSIGGLLLAYIYRFAPWLIQQGRVKNLRTPLVMAYQNNKVTNIFFNMDEYNVFISKNDIKKYKFKYHKGLGSIQPDVFKTLVKQYGAEYFIEDFEDGDEETDQLLLNWMSGQKGMSDVRKEMLRQHKFNPDKL